MYILLFSASIICSILLIVLFSASGKSIYQYFLYGNNLFLIQYLFFSLYFLSTDSFSVWKPLVILNLIDILIVVVRYIYNKKHIIKRQINRLKKEELVLFIAILVSIPLINVTTEDIGTVSDQGGYFFHTITLLEEKENDIHTLKELGKISSEVDAGLRNLQSSMSIYYHNENEDYYYPHALKTWCVIPALFGKMFGLWNCMKALNYIYILIVSNIFYICIALAQGKWGGFLSLGLFAFSPLILYIAKAGLTEETVLFLFSASIYFFLYESKIRYVFVGLCIGLIGYVHISMYAYFPLIYAVLFLLSSKNRQLTYVNLMQTILFGISIRYDYIISPIYVKEQYKRFLFDGKMNFDDLWLIIIISILFLIVLQSCVIFSVRLNNCIQIVYNFILRHFRSISILIVGIILIKTIQFAYFLSFTDLYAIPKGTGGTWDLREQYVNTGIKAISHLNIVNIGRATGMVGLISFLVIPFFKKVFTETTKILYLCELYVLIIFTVLQMDTPSNYYTSRYFVPFAIPLITLTLANNIKKKRWYIYVIFVALMYNIHFLFAFFDGSPQRGQYEILQDTLSVIPSESIVFCNPDSLFINTRICSNLRILNDNEVYNLKNYEEVSAYYSDKPKYVISHIPLELDNNTLLLANVYQSQYSFGNGPNGTYATSNGSYDVPIFIYNIDP